MDVPEEERQTSYRRNPGPTPIIINEQKVLSMLYIKPWYVWTEQSVDRTLLATVNSGSHSPEAHCQVTEHLDELSSPTWSGAMRRTADIRADQLPDPEQQSVQTQQLNKLKRFLATIQQFGDGLSVEIGDLVRGLVVAVAVSVCYVVILKRWRVE